MKNQTRESIRQRFVGIITAFLLARIVSKGMVECFEIAIHRVFAVHDRLGLIQRAPEVMDLPGEHAGTAAIHLHQGRILGDHQCHRTRPLRRLTCRPRRIFGDIAGDHEGLAAPRGTRGNPIHGGQKGCRATEACMLDFIRTTIRGQTQQLVHKDRCRLGVIHTRLGPDDTEPDLFDRHRIAKCAQGSIRRQRDRILPRWDHGHGVNTEALLELADRNFAGVGQNLCRKNLRGDIGANSVNSNPHPSCSTLSCTEEPCSSAKATNRPKAIRGKKHRYPS